MAESQEGQKEVTKRRYDLRMTRSPEYLAKLRATMATPEYRQKMSAIVRARGDEWKQKGADKRRGQVMSAETKAKIGAAHRGMKRSATARANMAEARKRSPLTDGRRQQIKAVHAKNRGAKRSAAAKERISTGKILKWAQTPVDVRKAHMMPAVKASRRARPSSIEIAVRSLLASVGIAFESEYRIGPYLVDVFVASTGLVIECDGEYWHRNTKERDAKRDAYMENLGYRVLRLPEGQIKSGEFSGLVMEAVS